MHITRISSLDGLELKDATFSKQIFPAHFHDSYSLGLIEEGIEQLTFADRTFAAPARSIIVINPHDVHANAFFDADPWRYRALYLGVEMLRFAARRAGWRENGPIWFAREAIQDDWLYAALLRIHNNPAADTTISDLTDALGLLVRRYATSAPESTFIRPALQAVVADAAAYIRQHAADPLRVEALAAQHRLSPTGFIRAFKQVTGLPPIAYALLHRVSQAKTLITAGYPLVDVALETGFYDQSHFTNYFKRYVGLTPVAYRTAVRVI